MAAATKVQLFFHEPDSYYADVDARLHDALGDRRITEAEATYVRAMLAALPYRQSSTFEISVLPPTVANFPAFATLSKIAAAACSDLLTDEVAMFARYCLRNNIPVPHGFLAVTPRVKHLNVNVE